MFKFLSLIFVLLQKVTEKVVDFRKISSGIFLNSDSRLPPCMLSIVGVNCTRIEQLFVQRHKSVDLAVVATF